MTLPPRPGALRLVVSELAGMGAAGEVLGPFSFALRGGEIVGVLGQAGSGRRGLLDLLAGRCKVRQGSIVADGAMVERLSASRRVAAGVVEVDTAPRQVRGMTVVDWLGLAAKVVDHGALKLMAIPWRSISRQQRAEIESILEFCGCLGIGGYALAELDEAQLRLVDVARGLCQRPGVLLLRRPFAGLSGRQREHVRELLERIAAEQVALLVADEQLDIMTTCCHRMIVLSHGQIVAKGTVDEIAVDEAAFRAFSGGAPELHRPEDTNAGGRWR